MSVSDPNNSTAINCTIVEMYTQSHFLKLGMVTQLLAAILSLLSISLTLRKIFTTVMIDRAFKEYLLACYAVQLIQCTALALLQTILLITYLTSAPCEAFIPARLCYLLRITSTTISILPFLNVALTLFRFFVLQKKSGSSDAWSEWLWICRGLQFSAIASCLGFQVYKYWNVNMDGYAVYCIGNFQGVANKLLLESIVMAFCEAFSIIFSGYLFRSYKRSDRTFEVNCSLLRRQAIQTFHLFISFSIIQAVTFWGFVLIGALFRFFLSGLKEPYYSAGSSMVFIPMYYTIFSPWLIYYILKREETKRVKGTNDLLAKENIGITEYFAMTNCQWAEPATTKNDQTTNVDRFIRFVRMTRNGIFPAKESLRTTS